MATRSSARRTTRCVAKGSHSLARSWGPPRPSPRPRRKAARAPQPRRRPAARRKGPPPPAPLARASGSALSLCRLCPRWTAPRRRTRPAPTGGRWGSSRGTRPSPATRRTPMTMTRRTRTMSPGPRAALRPRAATVPRRGTRPGAPPRTRGCPSRGRRSSTARTPRCPPTRCPSTPPTQSSATASPSPSRATMRSWPVTASQ
mmetsp:Transcript_11540/g.39398  ORF Transcript_11540/g.39398 Transcript_11540/m.39398 type:complete len:202 (-) Transcript_11540:1089-1694(-)